MKESAARLTKIPSTLVIHRPTAGVDTRLATYRHAIVDNPLENILGLHEPGRYRQAEPDQPFAYDKIENLWQEDIDNMPQSDSEVESDDDNGSSNEDNDDDDDDTQRKSNQLEIQDEHMETQETATPNEETKEPATPNEQKTLDDATNEQPAANCTTKEINVSKTAKRNSNTKRKRHEEQITPRTSTRTANKPARYRDHEITTSSGTQPSSEKLHKAHKLYKLTRKSRDKLFFIKYTIDTTNIPRGYLVQAKLQDDDSTTTRNEGMYTVWFYIREQSNSKTRQQRNCRYWPEVHQVRPNGRLGQITPIRPGKVETTLKEHPDKYQVYTQTIDLCENAMVGPFDFAVPKHYQQESNRIAFEDWEELKTAAKRHNVDVSDIEDTIPLR